MEKQIILHGGEVLNEEEEDPVFLSEGRDDELAMEEDDEVSEMIKRLKEAHINIPRNVHLSESDEDEDEDDELVETEIVSIVDATTGEHLNFHIEGEDFDRVVPSDFFKNLKSLVRKQQAVVESKADQILEI